MRSRRRGFSGVGLSWQIFTHAVRQVFGNLDRALRISAVPTLGLGAVMAIFGPPLTPQEFEAQMQAGQIDGVALGMTLLLQLALWLWVVVAWHRHMLLNERSGLLPVFRPARMLAYLGKSILISLMAVLLGFALAVLAGAMAYMIFGVSLAHPGRNAVFGVVVGMMVIVYLPSATVGVRLGTMLPGAALGPDVPLFIGWEATRGATGTIFGVVLLSTLAVLVLEFLAALIFKEPNAITSILWIVLVQWMVAMVGASVLTAFNGHYIEKRPLV